MSAQEILLETRAGPVSGLRTAPASSAGPLIVALPGGSYTARYFDVPGYSLLDIAESTGFTVVALDRPGYGATLPPDDQSFAGSAAALDLIIADLWEQHAEPTCPGIVIISHSIGSAVAVHLAAREPQWPLLGVALHGISDVAPDAVRGAWNSMPPGQPVVFSDEQRRAFMYGPKGTLDETVVQSAAISTAPIPLYELLEVVGEWPTAAAALANKVRVPVHYRLAEFEALWVPGEEHMSEFASLFTAAPSVDAAVFQGSGHNIDHHHLGRSLHLQQLAFAWACACR